MNYVTQKLVNLTFSFIRHCAKEHVAAVDYVDRHNVSDISIACSFGEIQ